MPVTKNINTYISDVLCVNGIALHDMCWSAIKQRGELLFGPWTTNTEILLLKLETSGLDRWRTINERNFEDSSFSMYQIIFELVLVKQSKDFRSVSLYLHVQHASWDLQLPNFPFCPFSNWMDFKLKMVKNLPHSCVRDTIPCLEPTEEKVGWAQPPYSLQQVQQHTASDVVLCKCSRWWFMSCTLLLLTVDGV